MGIINGLECFFANLTEFWSGFLQKSIDVLLEKQSSRQNFGFQHGTINGLECFFANLTEFCLVRR